MHIFFNYTKGRRHKLINNFLYYFLSEVVLSRGQDRSRTHDEWGDITVGIAKPIHYHTSTPGGRLYQYLHNIYSTLHQRNNYLNTVYIYMI
jgi:hypothetical protein